jgi:hypothetical protein
MKAGGYIGIGLGGLSSALAVQEVCSADPESPACKKVKIIQGGRFAGSVTGGIFGGGAAGWVAANVCLGLTAVTAPAAGSGGLVCVIVTTGAVGLGAWSGGEAGANAGELIGEIIHEKTSP